MSRVPFTEKEKDTEPKPRPSIRNIDDVWCWMNTWGDERKHEGTLSWSAGYRQCIRDLYAVLREAGINDVPDEAWDRWTNL